MQECWRMTDQIKEHLGIREILADKREEILRLASAHGATNVRIFGSVARGEANETSDVDFLVDWDYARISSWGGAGFGEALESLLGRPIDVATEKQLRPAMRERVLRECVPL